MEHLIWVLLHVPAQQKNANDRPLGDVLFCSFYTICDPIHTYIHTLFVM